MCNYQVSLYCTEIRYYYFPMRNVNYITVTILCHLQKFNLTQVMQ